MFKEMNNEEMMKVDGGNDGIDAFVGTMEVAWAIPVGIATSVVATPAAGVAAGGAIMADGISHLKDVFE